MNIAGVYKYTINIEVLAKRLGFLSIFLAPIDRYLLNVPFFFNLSLYRVSFILFSIASFFVFFNRNSIKSYSNLYILLALYVLTILFNIFRLTDVSYISYYINEIMGITMIFLFVNLYSFKDINKLIKWFVGSAIWPILLALFVYYVYFHEVRLVDVLPLTDKLGLFKHDQFDTKPLRLGFFPRLGLPFATSPHLAVAVSCMLVFQFFRLKNTANKWLNIILFSFLVFLFIGTLTRTVYVSLTLSIFFYLFFIDRRRILIKPKILILISILLIVGIPLFMNTMLFDKLMHKFSSRSLTEDRHFLLYLEGWDILTHSLKTFFIGIGDGNLNLFEGKRTVLPPESLLSSYLTLLVFRGLIGFTIVMFLYMYILMQLLNNVIYYRNNLNKALFIVAINIALAFALYELRFVNSIWIVLAISSVYILKEKENVGIYYSSHI